MSRAPRTAGRPAWMGKGAWFVFRAMFNLPLVPLVLWAPGWWSVVLIVVNWAGYVERGIECRWNLSEPDLEGPV